VLLELLLQANPFGPVPTPTPTPLPGAGGDDVSRTTLYLIALGVLVAIVAIGYLISRDARRSLTAEDRAELEREERAERAEGAAIPPRPAKKAKARRKAARRARRHNRP